MVQDYQDLTSINVEAENEETENEEVENEEVPRVFLKYPTTNPPWRQHVCSSRLVVLILLVLCGILLIAVTVFGINGSNSSSHLFGMTKTLIRLNDTVAAEMVTLQDKGKDTDAKLAKVNITVKGLNDETQAANARLQTQLATLRKNLQVLKCDLENFQKNRTENPDTCCPQGWAVFRKNCYWDSRAGKSWEDAKVDCEDRGAHLLIVNSYEERLFASVRVRPDYMWIGLTDASGSWKWVDGTPYTVRSEDWVPDQPDDWYGHNLGGGEDCAHFHRNGLWNDDHCSRLYGWICEMEGKE